MAEWCMILPAAPKRKTDGVFVAVATALVAIAAAGCARPEETGYVEPELEIECSQECADEFVWALALEPGWDAPGEERLACPHCGAYADSRAVASFGSLAFERLGDGVAVVGFSGDETWAIIPAEYRDGSPVVAIGESAFANSALSRVSIPASVAYIGDWAFAGSRLESVEIPEGATRIGAGAFRSNRLREAVIPDSVTSLGDWAFADNLIESVEIGAGLVRIPDAAFLNNRLSVAIIPGGVAAIGNSAFFGNRIERVEIGSGVVEIGASAFAGNRLAGVSIPAGVATIGASAFADNLLSEIEIPGGVSFIGGWAFAGNRLENVSVPANVATMGMAVFADNPRLGEIRVPFAALAQADAAWWWGTWRNGIGAAVILNNSNPPQQIFPAQ